MQTRGGGGKKWKRLMTSKTNGEFLPEKNNPCVSRRLASNTPYPQIENTKLSPVLQVAKLWWQRPKAGQEVGKCQENMMVSRDPSLKAQPSPQSPIWPLNFSTSPVSLQYRGPHWNQSPISFKPKTFCWRMKLFIHPGRKWAEGRAFSHKSSKLWGNKNPLPVKGPQICWLGHLCPMGRFFIYFFFFWWKVTASEQFRLASFSVCCRPFHNWMIPQSISTRINTALTYQQVAKRCWKQVSQHNLCQETQNPQL